MKCPERVFTWHWETAPEAVSLDAREVHVWAGLLDADDPGMPLPDGLLSSEELARANRYHLTRDRDRFRAARSFLRRILSRYTGWAPECIRFVYGPHGKPQLEGACSRVRFNVSHSEAVILCAVAMDHEVGIDVETIRPIADWQGIAKRFFAPGEFAALAALPQEFQLEGFYHCWTRKEAYLKGRGDGIGDWLNQFEVSLKPGEPARLLLHRAAPEEVNRWSLHVLRPAPGFVSALAVEGSDSLIRCWSCPTAWRRGRPEAIE